MASASEEIYFPPLDDCLKGARIVLSWQLIATALSDISGQRQKSQAVVDFLNDAHVKRLLSSPATAFAPPDADTKSNYETRTAAANATSSTDGRHDIQKIKEHSQWLSQQANLNLVAALRIVIVEFQNRASSHLAGPLSSQDVTNLREAAELGTGQDSMLVSTLGSIGAGDAESLWTMFEEEASTKLRIFDTYLSERRHLMMTVDYIHSIMLYQRLPIATPIEPDHLPSLYSQIEPPTLAVTLKTYLKLMENAMENIEAGVETVAKDPDLREEPTTAMEWTRTWLVEVVHSLSVLFQSLDAYRKEFAPSSWVGEWFSLMELYAFLDKLEPINEQIAQLLVPIKTLVSAVSLLLVRPMESLIYLDGDRDDSPSIDDAYLTQSDVLEAIHASIVNAADSGCESAAPVMFAWTLVTHRMYVSLHERLEKRDNLLHQSARETFEGSMTTANRRPTSGRRNSAGSMMSIETLKFDSFLQTTGLDKGLQTIEQLARIATDQCRVFDVLATMSQTAAALNHTSLAPLLGHRIRSVFLDFVVACYPVIGYQSDPVSCLVSVLSVEQQSPVKNFSTRHNITDVALQDNLLLRLYFQQSLDRYPFEFLPFIKLCRALCSGSPTLADDRSEMVVSLLGRTPSLTFILPAHYQSFEMPPSEEDNTNDFILTEDLSLISPPHGRGKASASDDFRIPAGTVGRFIADSGRVVLMQLEHSGLGLLGRRLELSLNKESCHSGLGPLQAEETAEAIALIADLVRTEHVKVTQSGVHSVLMDPERDVLSEASRYLGGNKDIISVVCATMDFYLQDGQATNDDEAGIAVLRSCVQFLQSILPQCPSRVWSYMARCDLLNSDSQAGKLGKLVGELDLVLERYGFLLATVRLWSSMLDTAMSSAVQRRCGSQFAYRQRSGSGGSSNPWTGLADRILERVCYAMVQATADIFENSATWRFSSDFDRIVLVSELVPVLNKVVVYAYGLDGKDGGAENLMGCFDTAASYTVEAFLSSSTGSLRFQAILGAFASTFKTAITASTSLLPNLHRAVASQLDAVAGFIKTILRVAVLKGLPSSTLERRLFKSSTLVARLTGVSYSFKRPALRLLDVLVSTAGKAEAEPPSLLGYLGTQTSKSFLQTLARLDSPFNSSDEQVASWKLFSAIVSNRQQWMANCLLTGKTPREGLRNAQGIVEPSRDSVLVVALKQLKILASLGPQEALATLEFIATALNYWPRTIMVIQKEARFLDGLQEFVRELRSPMVTARTDVVRASVEARLAAYVGQIFAMQLHHIRQMGKGQAVALSLVKNLDYYLRDAAQVSGYNKSLHANFSKNFAERYPGCSLESFKRSLVVPRELGKSFYYDLERANDMLQFDPSWASRRGNGFRSEMELANGNLSLVDAEVALFNAWRVLLLEIINCFPGPIPIATQMLQVTRQCLDANQNSRGPSGIFDRIIESRAELALVLVQRLAGTSLSSRDANDLLGNTLVTFDLVQEPFSARSIAYTRTLLRLFFVTLRAFTIGQNLADGGGGPGGRDTKRDQVPITQTVLSLLDRVVARGFRTLVGFIHDTDARVVVPEDLALLTAILQACLCVPDMEQSQTPILNIMATHDTPRVASSLFSWCDKVTVDGDPIYGELSLLFLVELSKLPVVAEQLACDGILGNMMAANIIKYMQRSNNTISPLAENQVAQRCYGIWTKGILLLLLNLLTAMGSTIAPEVAYVLNQFPHLLRASIDGLEPPGVNRTAQQDQARYVTLLAVSELHSLALLVRIIGALRMNNTRDIAEVSWDAPAVLENVEFWLSTRRLLRERLLPMGPREQDWAGLPTGRMNPDGQPETKLEERTICQLEAVRDVLMDEEGNE